MLRIYVIVIEVIVGLRPVFEELRRKDPELEWQARRAAQSIALNVAEGSAGVGKNRNLRYATALGSMRDTSACLDVALALGYVRGISPELRAKIDRVTGTVVRLTAPHATPRRTRPGAPPDTQLDTRRAQH